MSLSGSFLRSLRNRRGSHPEDAELRRWNGRVERKGDAKCKHLARASGVENPVIPDARRGVVRRSFVLVLRQDRPADLLLLVGAQLLALARQLIALQSGQDRG